MSCKDKRWRASARAVWALGMGVACFVPDSASAQDQQALLRRAGLSPVVPTPARDFTLPLADAGSGEFTLSQQLGSWVLLTFFASWCGPCAQEMPTLVKLHQDRGGAGLAIVGVALQADPIKVRRFVDRFSVTFVVVYDAQSTVGAAYQASGIPVSYLIDPQGNVIGVARGARDWRRFAVVFDQLSAGAAVTSPSGGGAPAGVAPGPAPGLDQGEQPLQLPADFEPPSAEVVGPESSPQPGEVFPLRVDINWTGTLQDYLLHPPSLQMPAGVELRRTEASSTARLGRSVIQYRLWLVAPEPGEYRLSPVEVRYTPRGEKTPVARRVSGPIVRVAAAPLLIWPWATGGGGAAAAVVAAVMIVAARRRKQQLAVVSSARAEREEIHEDLNDLLLQAKKARVRGDQASVLEAIVAWHHSAAAQGLSVESDRVEAEKLSQGIRFAGLSPATEHLEPLLRKIERAMRDMDETQKRDQEQS